MLNMLKGFTGPTWDCRGRAGGAGHLQETRNPQTCGSTTVGQSLEVGARVKVHSLKAASQHNEICGKLLRYISESERWAVELSTGTEIAVRPSNLALVASGKTDSRNETPAAEDANAEQHPPVRGGLQGSVGKVCSVCSDVKGKDLFSGKQWGAKAHARKCKFCVVPRT